MRRLVARALGTVGRRWRRSPFALGAVVALVLGLGVGSAYAFLTASGLGTGTATVRHATAVTVLAATGTPSSKLHPGASADLTLTITNPNSFPVKIVSISQKATPLTVVGGTSCTAGNSGVTVPTQSGLSISVTPGTTSVHVPNGASMSTSSANGCQGASFRIPVTVTVEQ